MENTLKQLIQEAMNQLENSGLASGTLKSYRSQAFQPVENYYVLTHSTLFKKEYLQQLKGYFIQQYSDEIISRNSMNWRLRGINILLEICDYGVFEWKVYSHKTKIQLSDYFETILMDFMNGLLCSIKRKHNYESILRRFLGFISKQKITSFSEISQLIVRDFIIDISSSKPKSMDDVITALRKLFLYLNENSYCKDNFWMLLAAPRSRDHRVRPCMKLNETSQLIQMVDRSTPEGKRDFAILTLAAIIGLRVGDIASLKLSDIDWIKNELHIVQGKTQVLLILPLSKNILTAIADYILNGRPETNDGHLFIRSCAPYVSLQDGVSISCIFRKYLKASGIIHNIDDGRTMQGLRRAIGTQMVSEEISVSTIAQVLGHSGIKATKQYISLDLDGLRKCVLGLDSIGGELQ